MFSWAVPLPAAPVVDPPPDAVDPVAAPVVDAPPEAVDPDAAPVVPEPPDAVDPVAAPVDEGESDVSLFGIVPNDEKRFPPARPELILVE